MPPTSHLLALAVTAFVLIVVPGPSVLFTVGRALAVGGRGALLTVVGNTGGLYVQVIAVALGVGASVEASWFADSPRRIELLGATGGLAMIGIGASLAATDRKD